MQGALRRSLSFLPSQSRYMTLSARLQEAVRAGLVHLFASAIVAVVCGVLVFGLWYPHPYSELTGGRTLFIVLVAVDVVCGPLLTMVVFDRRKPRTELRRDIALIVLLQLTALGYGLASVLEARPVYLAYEGDRFRVVTLAEVDPQAVSEAPKGLQSFGWTGPELLGVRLLQPGDPEYLRSVQLALEGVHPALRPSRWVPYTEQVPDVLRHLRPVSLLKERHPQLKELIERTLARASLDAAQAGFLPVVSRHGGDWVVLVSRKDGRPVGFLQVDGW